MEDPASRHTHALSFLHSNQDSIPANPDPFAATNSSDTSSSLQESIPHPGLNSTTVDDTGTSQVDLSLLHQPTAQTSAGQLGGLFKPSTETHAVTNAEQEPVNAMGQVPVKSEGEVLVEQVNAQVELLEGSSDNSIMSGDTTLAVQESQEWIPQPDHELKRVKVRDIFSFLLLLYTWSFIAGSLWSSNRAPPFVVRPLCQKRLHLFLGLPTHRSAVGGSRDGILFRTIFR